MVNIRRIPNSLHLSSNTPSRLRHVSVNVSDDPFQLKTFTDEVSKILQELRQNLENMSRGSQASLVIKKVKLPDKTKMETGLKGAYIVLRPIEDSGQKKAVFSLEVFDSKGTLTVKDSTQRGSFLEIGDKLNKQDNFMDWLKTYIKQGSEDFKEIRSREV